MLLLDSKRRVVVQNRGAERILAADDGFRIDRHGPSADDARENATLQKLIADAMEPRAGQEIRSAGFVAISRPSGERSYAVMVTPLLAAPRSVMSDAVVALFVADPSARFFAGSEALSELYQLTHSEAELVRLLASGLSLEEAADKRGVSMNTARSHLKHVFAKTDTSRQGELVRLIVSGVGQIARLSSESSTISSSASFSSAERSSSALRRAAAAATPSRGRASRPTSARCSCATRAPPR